MAGRGQELLVDGRGVYGSSRWGDYSATTLDPTDDWSFWTVQEYAYAAGDSDEWRTAIAKLRPEP